MAGFTIPLTSANAAEVIALNIHAAGISQVVMAESCKRESMP